MGYEDGRGWGYNQKRKHTIAQEKSPVLLFSFSWDLKLSKKLPPFLLSRLRMPGSRRLHCLLCVEVSGSFNLLESKANLSRKYLVQKKTIDCNTGLSSLEKHRNFPASAFSGGWSQLWGRLSLYLHLWCKEVPCTCPHARELIRNTMSQCLSGIPITYHWGYLWSGLCGRPLAACPPRKQNISETSPVATASSAPRQVSKFGALCSSSGSRMSRGYTPSAWKVRIRHSWYSGDDIQSPPSPTKLYNGQF